MWSWAYIDKDNVVDAYGVELTYEACMTAAAASFMPYGRLFIGELGEYDVDFCISPRGKLARTQTLDNTRTR